MRSARLLAIGAAVVAIAALMAVALRPPRAASDRLTWAPPTLEDPVEVTAPADGSILELEPGRDHRVVLPPHRPVPRLWLKGGRNVVVIGGEVDARSAPEEWPAALSAQDFTGTLHLEGLRVRPGGDRGIARDAIRVNSEAPGSVAQVQNVRVDRVHGTREGFHGDVLQTWAGPGRLRVDRLDATTDYQGFYLAPRHFSDATFARPWADIRRTSVDVVGDGAYTAYVLSDQGGSTGPSWLDLDDVVASPAERDCDDAGDGPFRAAGARCRTRLPDRATGAGIGYRSPGYAEPGGRKVGGR